MSSHRVALLLSSSVFFAGVAVSHAGDIGGIECSGAQLDRVTRAGSASGDEFGRAVAIDGIRAIVGAHLADDIGNNAGAASIFEQFGITWLELGQLTASDGAANDNFGSAVAIDGDLAVVGAERDNGVGSAYVFEWDGGSLTWIEIDKITTGDAQAGDLFGGAVAISGTTIVVGAHQHDAFGSNAGAVYVYDRVGDNWVRTQKIGPGPGSAGEGLGFAVDIIGNTIMASAPGFGSDGRGAAYFYELGIGPDPWIENGHVTAPDAEDGDFFGRSIGLGNDHAIVGAFRDDDVCPTDANCDSGSAWILFRAPDGGAGNWTAVKKLTASNAAEADLFGFSVGISGSNAVVSALHTDDSCPANPDCNSGSCYVFLRNAGGSDVWDEVALLTANEGLLGDSLGRDCGISGDSVVGGAHRTDDVGSNSGAAYFFEIETACGCAADFDVDSIVGFSDLLQLLSLWGDCECVADFDEDGAVGFSDLLFLLAVWGPCE